MRAHCSHMCAPASLGGCYTVFRHRDEVIFFPPHCALVPFFIFLTSEHQSDVVLVKHTFKNVVVFLL